MATSLWFFYYIDPRYVMERHAGMAKTKKKIRASNCQDFVFIWQPSISHGAFKLRMDHVWF
jgi:hypothetical protein